MRRLTVSLMAFVLGGAMLVGCGNDDNGADVDIDVDGAVEDVREGARDVWASFQTGWERLIDEAATGDDEAQNELLDECRDALQDLREAGEGEAADDLQDICDAIRDADEGEDWTTLRTEYEQFSQRF